MMHYSGWRRQKVWMMFWLFIVWEKKISTLQVCDLHRTVLNWTQNVKNRGFCEIFQLGALRSFFFHSFSLERLSQRPSAFWIMENMPSHLNHWNVQHKLLNHFRSVNITTMYPFFHSFLVSSHHSQIRLAAWIWWASRAANKSTHSQHLTVFLIFPICYNIDVFHDVFFFSFTFR